jgi:hypothetical protein
LEDSLRPAPPDNSTPDADLFSPSPSPSAPPPRLDPREPEAVKITAPWTPLGRHAEGRHASLMGFHVARPADRPDHSPALSPAALEAAVEYLIELNEAIGRSGGDAAETLHHANRQMGALNLLARQIGAMS